jgi:murein DD-endopeptidase MepM/ murein hydrolase activator NlpD
MSADEQKSFSVTYKNTAPDWQGDWGAGVAMYALDSTTHDFHCSSWSGDQEVIGFPWVYHGQSRTRSFDICANGQSAGSYTLRFGLKITAGGSVIPGSEFYFTVQIAGGGGGEADLVVDHLEVTRNDTGAEIRSGDTVPDGTSITVQVYEKNIGGADAEDFYLAYYDNGGYVDDDYESSTVSAGGDDIETESDTFIISGAGLHTLRVDLDTTDVIPESDENNNSATFTLNVDAGDPADPRLYAGLDADPTSLTQGESLNASYTVKNYGDQSITFKTLSVSCRSPNDDNCDFGAMYDVTLEGGQSYTLEATEDNFGLPGVNGTYVLKASYQLPDGSWHDFEPGESGTQTSVSVHITAPATPADPGLYAGLSATPTSLHQGETLNASYTVKNYGDQSITFKTLSVSCRSPNDDNCDFGAMYDVTLEGGQSYTLEATEDNFGLPDVNGTYVLKASYQLPDNSWHDFAPGEPGTQTSVNVEVADETTYYNISGYVRDDSGNGISGVTVSFGGTRPAVTTNSDGYYSQSGFANGSYTVTPGKSGYTFAPASQNVTINESDLDNVDFTGVSSDIPIYNTPFLSDEELEDYESMTVDDVRNFLTEKGSYFKQPVQDVDGQTFDPPEVIVQAARTYRINPKVIIVTLQKENSGVTRSTRPSTMAFLMGCVSSSTARQQLTCAAERFRAYHDQLSNTGSTVSGWQVGVPKVTEDGVQVTPATKAVAGQFTYTPYAGTQWHGDDPKWGGVYLFFKYWNEFFGGQSLDSSPSGHLVWPPQNDWKVGDHALLRATAEDKSGSGIKYVRFVVDYQDSCISLHDDYSAPYEYNWDMIGYDDGEYGIGLIVEDNNGQQYAMPLEEYRTIIKDTSYLAQWEDQAVKTEDGQTIDPLPDAPDYVPVQAGQRVLLTVKMRHDSATGPSWFNSGNNALGLFSADEPSSDTSCISDAGTNDFNLFDFDLELGPHGTGIALLHEDQIDYGQVGSFYAWMNVPEDFAPGRYEIRLAAAHGTDWVLKSETDNRCDYLARVWFGFEVENPDYVGKFDLPVDYSTTLAKAALGWNTPDGRVNSWFDHQYPDYTENGFLLRWDGETPPENIGAGWYDGHNGTDFNKEEYEGEGLRRNVYAVARGEIIEVVDTCNFNCYPKSIPCGSCGYGNYVMIYHDTGGGEGYTTMYSHFWKNDIEDDIHVGDTVEAGQRIGYMGNTGNSSGTHLHFGVYKGRVTNPSSDKVLDPYGWNPHPNSPNWGKHDPCSSSTECEPGEYLWKEELSSTAQVGSRIRATSDELQAAMIQLVSPSGDVTAFISPEAFTSTTTVELADRPAPRILTELYPVGASFWLATPSHPSLSNTAQPVILVTNYYSDTGPRQHLDLGQLALYHWDEASKSWISTTATVDAATEQVVAQTQSLSRFSLQAPLICPADAQEPYDDTSDTGELLTPDGTPIERLFDISEDQDWFRLSATGGVTYSVWTQNLGGGADTVLSIYDTDETLLATDDNAGSGSTSYLEWQPQEDGLYFVKIEPVSGSSYGCDVTYEVVAQVETIPVNLTAEPGYASIQLDWNPTNDPHVTAYRISRAISSTETFTTVATVTGTVYFDADPDLIPHTNYCYYVEALQADGSVVVTSNTACVPFSRTDLWAPDTWAEPGETAIVPVNVRNAEGLHIAASDIWLDFDSSVISPLVISRTALTADYAWAYHITSTESYSRARIAAIASPPPQLYGDGSLFWVTFQVTDTAGLTSPLNLRDFISGVGGSTIYAPDDLYNPIPLYLQDGTFYVEGSYTLGDLNGNGVVAAADAFLAMQIANGELTPTWEQRQAGDVNGNGEVDTADANMILYYAAHQSWPLPDNTPANRIAALNAINGPQINSILSLDDAKGLPGAVITTTLRVQNLSGCTGAEFTIVYDRALVSGITDVTATGLATGFDSEYHDDGAGMLRVALTEEGDVLSGSGVLVVISMRLASDAPIGGSAPLALAEARLNDVMGRDFATSAIQRTVERHNGVVSITGHRIYLPVVLRQPSS